MLAIDYELTIRKSVYVNAVLVRAVFLWTLRRVYTESRNFGIALKCHLKVINNAAMAVDSAQLLYICGPSSNRVICLVPFPR